MPRTRGNPTYAAPSPEALEARRLLVWRYRVETGASAESIRLTLAESHGINVTRQTVLTDLRAVMAKADEELRAQVKGWRATEVSRLDVMMRRVETRMSRNGVTDAAFDRFMNTLCRISDQRSKLLALYPIQVEMPTETEDKVKEMRKLVAAINNGSVLPLDPDAATTDAPDGFPSPDEAVTAHDDG